jgi:Protein of unknown function (DUF3085)
MQLCPGAQRRQRPARTVRWRSRVGRIAALDGPAYPPGPSVRMLKKPDSKGADKMRLTFPWTGVEKILEELHTAETAKTLYEQETGKGFWLVGDHGVYLMPNTTDGSHHKNRQPDEMLLVVHAKECDPGKLDFDTWWANKGASFGGDNGVEFIALETIENMAADAPHKKARPHALLIDITPEQFGLKIAWRSG